MRPEAEYRQALELIAAGVNDCEIGRRMGIPRGTIRDWRVGPRKYRYTRYQFSNRSQDILNIFTDALDMLDVHWTRTSACDVAVSRRNDVAFLDTFVGPKS